MFNCFLSFFLSLCTCTQDVLGTNQKSTDEESQLEMVVRHLVELLQWDPDFFNDSGWTFGIQNFDGPQGETFWVQILMYFWFEMDFFGLWGPDSCGLWCSGLPMDFFFGIRNFDDFRVQKNCGTPPPLQIFVRFVDLDSCKRLFPWYLCTFWLRFFLDYLDLKFWWTFEIQNFVSFWCLDFLCFFGSGFFFMPIYIYIFFLDLGKWCSWGGRFDESFESVHKCMHASW